MKQTKKKSNCIALQVGQNQETYLVGYMTTTTVNLKLYDIKVPP